MCNDKLKDVKRDKSKDKMTIVFVHSRLIKN